MGILSLSEKREPSLGNEDPIFQATGTENRIGLANTPKHLGLHGDPGTRPCWAWEGMASSQLAASSGGREGPWFALAS